MAVGSKITGDCCDLHYNTICKCDSVRAAQARASRGAAEHVHGMRPYEALGAPPSQLPGRLRWRKQQAVRLELWSPGQCGCIVGYRERATHNCRELCSYLPPVAGRCWRQPHEQARLQPDRP